MDADDDNAETEATDSKEDNKSDATAADGHLSLAGVRLM